MYHTSKFVRWYIIIMYNVSAWQFEPSHLMVLHYHYVLYFNTIWIINIIIIIVSYCVLRVLYYANQKIIVHNNVYLSTTPIVDNFPVQNVIICSCYHRDDY